MWRFYFILFLIISFSFCSRNLFAQQNEQDYFPTPNTLKDAPPDPKKQKEKEKRIRYIIKPSTKNTLMGNRCFEEATRKMGFQYLAVPKGQPPYKNEFAKFCHNFGVKFILFFKNGPFWKARVNKKLEDCRFGSGDYVG